MLEVAEYQIFYFQYALYDVPDLCFWVVILEPG
jgi:hypothetical protein